MLLKIKELIKEEIKNLVTELKQTSYKYACLMLKYKVSKTWWSDIQDLIDEEDIVRVNGVYGREKYRDAHITIMYGLHDGIDVKEIEESVNQYQPKDIKLTRITYFEGPSYDVIKLNADYVFFKLMRRTLMKFPNTKTHNTYQPHMTICYVKKGKGRKYVQNLPTRLLRTLIVDKFKYTTKHGDVKYFDYRKN